MNTHEHRQFNLSCFQKQIKEPVINYGEGGSTKWENRCLEGGRKQFRVGPLKTG